MAQEATTTDHTPIAPSMSLVCLTRADEPTATGPAVRPDGAFLAQLLAGRHDMAHARQKRRAAPSAAVAAYSSCGVRPVLLRGSLDAAA